MPCHKRRYPAVCHHSHDPSACPTPHTHRCSRQRLPASACQRTLRALPLAGLLRTLAEGVVGQQAAAYGCRVAALVLMQELLMGIKAGDAGAEVGGRPA